MCRQPCGGRVGRGHRRAGRRPRDLDGASVIGLWAAKSLRLVLKVDSHGGLVRAGGSQSAASPQFSRRPSPVVNARQRCPCRSQARTRFNHRSSRLRGSYWIVYPAPAFAQVSGGIGGLQAAPSPQQRGGIEWTVTALARSCTRGSSSVHEREHNRRHVLLSLNPPIGLGAAGQLGSEGLSRCGAAFSPG